MNGSREKLGSPGGGSPSGSESRSGRTAATKRRVLLIVGVLMLVVGLGLAGLVVLQQSSSGSAAAERTPVGEMPVELLAPVEDQPTASPAAAEKQRPRNHPAAGAPRRLAVPRIGVSARVVGIEMNRKTVLWPPKDPQTIGWWKSGAKPGAHTGSALLIGHSVSRGGGAFDRLDQLKRGDTVRVQTGRGSVRYDVTSVKIYRKASLARDAQRVFSQSTRGRLVLVTCEDWDGKTWLSNAVVTAEPS